MKANENSKPESKDPLSLDYATGINGGDSLRNINSYEYLREINNAISRIRTEYGSLANARKIPKEFLPFARLSHLFNKDPNYDPEHAYGNEYTQFILDMEKNIGKIKAHVKELEEENNRLTDSVKKRENAAYIAYLNALREVAIYTIYANPNKGLERAAKMMEDITDKNSSGYVTKAIKRRMKKKREKKRNKTSPQAQDKSLARLSTTYIKPNYKPQSTTSMSSIRTYAYKLDEKNNPKTHLPIELRFGTQGQYHRKKWRALGSARVSPLFEDFLEIQQLKREKNPPPPFGKHTPITHIYFNNLGRDRDIINREGTYEKQLTDELEKLENRHENVAVITLPADKGLMDRNYGESLDASLVFSRILRIANNTSNEPIKDFYISNKTKQLLYGVDPVNKDSYNKAEENKVLNELLDATYKKLGIDKEQQKNLNPDQVQAIYFHFIKFELTHFIIDKLKPETFNMSCKDAIDRGGVSSAYYNLMKSLDEKPPMTEEEFHRALHAAPTLVKGRGMNDHVMLIWNAVDKYLKGNNPPSHKPDWLIKWRDDNSAIEELNKYITNREKFKIGLFGEFKSAEETKFSAAIKLRDYLDPNPNKPRIKPSPEEREAWKHGELGKIYNKMVKAGLVVDIPDEDKQLELDLKDISDQITALGRDPSIQDEEHQTIVERLLKKRNELIENYFQLKGWRVQSQLLITRHPESTATDKMLGLSPDATPSLEGVASLEPKQGEEKKHARNFMHLLLRNPGEEVTFARSNMIRAGMLCNMIMGSPHVKVKSCTNTRDFQETQGMVAAASTTPIPDDANDRALWGTEDKELLIARQALSDSINEESKNISTKKGGTYIGDESKGISKKSTEKRLDAIDNLLKVNNTGKTTWLVGHGKTSSNYFKHTFGKASKFDFSTTKSVYLLRDEKGKPFRFSPPGGIKINNKGRLEGVMQEGEHVLNSQTRYKRNNTKKFLCAMFKYGAMGLGMPFACLMSVMLNPLISAEKENLINEQLAETKKHTQDSKTRLSMWSRQAQAKNENENEEVVAVHRREEKKITPS